MLNERVYQQANIRENLVVFSRGFENRPIEEVQQSFHYSFLDEKDKIWKDQLAFNIFSFCIKLFYRSFPTPNSRIIRIFCKWIL